MRNENKIAESGADRRLGPLASLVRAAEPLEELTAEARDRIKRRLEIKLHARHRPAGLRLSIVVAASALLLAGGAAVAGHFGLIRWPKARSPRIGDEQAAGPTTQQRKRTHAKPAATGPGAIRENDVPSPAPTMAAEPSPPLRALAEPIVPSAQPAPPTTHPLLGMVPARSSRTTRTIPAAAARPSAGNAAKQASQLSDASSLPPSATTAPMPESPRLSGSTLPPSYSTPVGPSGPSLAMVTPDHSVPVLRPTNSAHPGSSPAPVADSQALLAQALRSLRGQHDPAAALDLLARHAALFPQSPLASERSLLEVEALLALRRHDDALLRLDGMSLDNDPRSAERHVVRGELRARAARWEGAAEDFEQALARLKKPSSWHERALWGRAMARAHAGDQTGARADTQLYLQTYPAGRFASQAARSSAAESRWRSRALPGRARTREGMETLPGFPYQR